MRIIGNQGTKKRLFWCCEAALALPHIYVIYEGKHVFLQVIWTSTD